MVFWLEMENLEDLMDRLVGQRYFDTEAEESFTVICIDPGTGMAILQYDDGVCWDEPPTTFTMDEERAEQINLEEDGLDSERYEPHGAGPQLFQACHADYHLWYPSPDLLWPDGPPESLPETDDSPGSAQNLYRQIVRCKRCGLSGDVLGEHGSPDDWPPWFCHECGDVVQSKDQEFVHDHIHCSECADQTAS